MWFEESQSCIASACLIIFSSFIFLCILQSYSMERSKMLLINQKNKVKTIQKVREQLLCWLRTKCFWSSGLDNSSDSVCQNILFNSFNYLIWVVGEGGGFTAPPHFAAFSNIFLETSVPNLVFFTCPILQILGKT